MQAKGTIGTVNFDGEFVTIDRSGLIARTTAGVGTVRIPAKSISMVRWEDARTGSNGSIMFVVAGVDSRADSVFGIDSDRHRVPFKKSQMPAFRAMRDAVEKAIAQIDSSPPPQAGPPAGWYSDPQGGSGKRWWDGSSWTEHAQE